jgi:hypothetical protein
MLLDNSMGQSDSRAHSQGCASARDSEGDSRGRTGMGGGRSSLSYQLEDKYLYAFNINYSYDIFSYDLYLSTINGWGKVL